MKIKFYISLYILLVCFSASATENHQLDNAVAKINQGKYSNIDSLLVYQQGELLSEHYFNKFNAETLHQTRSTFKSITGLLAAIAFDQGLMSPEEPLLALIPPFTRGIKVPADKRQIKVKDLLHMTSGLDCSEMPGTGPYHDEAVDNGPTPLKYSLAISITDKPGKKWRYCNANSFLLGVAISAALQRSGQSDIFHFAKDNLFTPLGITDYEIYRSPEGFLYTQGNARFYPQDLARFGLLVLNNGYWNGQQLIAEHHIKSILTGTVNTHWSWTAHLPNHPQNNAKYAYQWYQSVFYFNEQSIKVSHSWGNGGQFIFVIPQLEAVVLFNGSNYGDIEKQKQPFEIMHKHVLPALSNNLLTMATSSH